MRAVTIIGAVLAAAGLFMVIKGVTYAREESVFKLGELEAKVQREHSIPPWIGGAALGAGVVLVGFGVTRR
jgi:drug/metabolite transporter (DMT)-like permease